MAFQFIYNPRAEDAILRDPNGMVAQDLRRRAINVESQGKLNASGPPGPNVITGRLRSSITHEITTRPDGTLVARIGSNVEYAGFVEEKKPYLLPALEAAKI